MTFSQQIISSRLLQVVIGEQKSSFIGKFKLELWGPIIRGPGPFTCWGPKAQAEEGDGPGSTIQIRSILGTQPRTIQSSA